MKSVIAVHSYHHGNTRKIADAIGGELAAEVMTVAEMAKIETAAYDLIGFGAGIDSGRHYEPMLEFAEAMPQATGQKVFIFSTAGIAGKEKKKLSDHNALRDILCGKGYETLGEFACKGFNTNSFLKYLGGMNKGRPNADDISAASGFARELKGRVSR